VVWVKYVIVRMTTIMGYKNMQEYRIVVQYKNQQGRFLNDEVILEA
jgi:hypothetical protein